MSRAIAMARCWRLNTTQTASGQRLDIVQFSGSNPPQLHLTPLESTALLHPHQRWQAQEIVLPHSAPTDLFLFQTSAWTESVRLMFLLARELSNLTCAEPYSELRDWLHLQLLYVSYKGVRTAWSTLIGRWMLHQLSYAIKDHQGRGWGAYNV